MRSNRPCDHTGKFSPELDGIQSGQLAIWKLDHATFNLADRRSDLRPSVADHREVAGPIEVAEEVIRDRPEQIWVLRAFEPGVVNGVQELRLIHFTGGEQ